MFAIITWMILEKCLDVGRIQMSRSRSKFGHIQLSRSRLKFGQIQSSRLRSKFGHVGLDQNLIELILV